MVGRDTRTTTPYDHVTEHTIIIILPFLYPALHSYIYRYKDNNNKHPHNFYIIYYSDKTVCLAPKCHIFSGNRLDNHDES